MEPLVVAPSLTPDSYTPEGWNINHTVAALTIVYLLMQIGWLAWRWHRAAQGVEVKAD